MENIPDIEALLPRYFERITTDAENKLIEAWIKADAGNLRIARQMHTLSLAIDTLSIMQNLDIEKDLNKVKRKTKVRSLSWRGWILRIAAVMSIPLLISVLLLYVDRQKSVVAQMMEVKTNAGMTTSIVLPDSTIVYLNSESSLRYPTSFEDNIRKVELSGEAYFDVTCDSKKRFVVTTPHNSQIEVYGTRFNVEAYQADSRIATTLLKGSIGFLYKNKKGQLQKTLLEPYQKLVYEPQTGDIQCYATSGESEVSWKDGKVIFKNTPFPEILHILGKRFNVEFHLTNKALQRVSFTGTFTNQRLEHIMEFFRISSHIHWRYIESKNIKDAKLKIEVY